jgi:transcriptional regulator/type VI secretion system activator RovC-like protein
MAELDWKNPDDYAYLNDYNLHEWAWEFLRRNPEYRKAYFALEAMATKGILQEIQEDREKREAFQALHEATTEPWGLRLPSNPRNNFREAKVFFEYRAGVEILRSWTAPEAAPDTPWPGHPRYVALKFDFLYDVETQIEIAGDILRGFARMLGNEFEFYEPLAAKTRRFRVRQFPLYVRILDADLAGATIGAIGRVLFQGRADQRKNVKSVRETARQMAREDYRELLLLPPRPDV